MWIETINGFVNAAHVIKVTNKDDYSATVLHLVDGCTVELPYPIVDVGQMSVGHIVPAQRGFEVLYLSDPGTEPKPEIEREPIIAWRLAEGDEVVPMTPNGSKAIGRLNEAKCSAAVLFSDGQVCAEHGLYPNIEAWIAAEREGEEA
jgi:hypothetical protein